jgi:hypothetical protein
MGVTSPATHATTRRSADTSNDSMTTVGCPVNIYSPSAGLCVKKTHRADAPSTGNACPSIERITLSCITVCKCIGTGEPCAPITIASCSHASKGYVIHTAQSFLIRYRIDMHTHAFPCIVCSWLWSYGIVALCKNEDHGTFIHYYIGLTQLRACARMWLAQTHAAAPWNRPKTAGWPDE